MVIEEFKSIDDLPGYEISNTGILRRNGIQLSTPIAKNGYCRKYLKDLKKNILIHRVVASSFIPNPEGKPCVNHIDCNRTNNLVTNLEWCTIAENQRHASKLKRFPDQSGEKHGNTRYTNLQVSIIKEAINAGHRNCHIARYFKMHSSTVTMIKTGRQWKNA